MNSKPNISIVIPVYNSEKSLVLLVERINSVLSIYANSYEILLVNDASSDSSWDIIKTLVTDDKHILAINLMRNFGQHNALLCGIRAANYEVIITMDDDLQNPPESIPTLVDELQKGYDVVYGAAIHDVHSGALRSISSWIIRKMLQGAVGANVANNLSSFRAFRTQIRNGFEDFQSSFISIDVLLTWSTRSFTVVKVEHAPRHYGNSTYTIKKLFIHSINLITGFSTWPLQLASLMGFTFTLFGILILVYVVVRNILQGSVPGFPFLASIVAIFSGAQLFAIGIIGEYMLRIYQKTMNKPAYLERSRLHSNNMLEHQVNDNLIAQVMGD